ncbi:BTAD domain-containing putative transcriptional regulator [Allobacillus sp. GCM10007491]|uniref:Transcriptional regulator n=1 Tax=Allobacillus saliphilus TaxID=2912308 RepID=A0A941CRS7_9BACI|nr:BTAD domain-containing putative transcriptional regulator [Allobacillus saliphilus]MBR7552597.1 transcriptional regulator [Allobacillus saliphilus]
MRTVPIVVSQFTPPKIRDHFVMRAGLQKKLRFIPEYPLTLIYSSAGYGKSTGISQFVETTSERVSWFSVSAYDHDFLPFMKKIIYSIRRNIAQFGQHIIEEMESLDHAIQDADIWSFMAMVVNELSQEQERLIIIIDDAHHLMQSDPISTWLQLFIEHLPDHIHFVLSSRNLPDWPILSQMRVKSELLEVKQDDLKLNEEELEHLVFDLHGIELSEEAVHKIHMLTEGWTIACTMFVQQLKMGESVQNLLLNQTESLNDLFEYMMLEILMKQPIEIQQFLLDTSVFETISTPTIEEVLEQDQAGEQLERLSNQNLFLQKIDDENFRYHALFKVFLEKRLKQQDSDRFHQLQISAAEFFESNQNYERAIQHYQEIQATGKIAALLAEHGLALLKEGKLELLEKQLVSVPSDEPLLIFLKGEVFRYRSNYEDAEKLYDQSISLARVEDRTDVISLASEGKAHIYLDTIRPLKAKRLLEEAIRYREQHSDNQEDLARLYYMLGENLINSGSAKKAGMWLEKAKRSNLFLDDVNLEARIYLRTGELERAKRFLLDKKEQMAEVEYNQLPKSHRNTDILLSIIYSMLGEPEKGKTYAEIGLQQGVMYDSPFVEACGWMRLGHTEQLLQRYDQQTTEACYENALAIMEELNVSRGKAEPYMGLCMLYANNQEHEKALEAGMKGLQETEKVNDLWLSALILVCLGISSLQSNRMNKAAEFFEDASLYFHTCEDDYGKMVVTFWQAYLSHQTEDWADFYEKMEQFALIMQSKSYEFFLRKKTLLGPNDLQVMIPLLHQAYEQGIQQKYIGRLIHELGFNHVDNHPGYTLHIRTLGRLEVAIGPNIVRDSMWQREKAKELLELLVTKRSKLVRKDEIFEALWPGESEASANKKLKVTLNQLLKVVEPKRKARQESFFIKRDGNAYGLNPRAGIELDVDEFEHLILAGMDEKNPTQAKELLLKGLELYEGDYLSTRGPSDWVLSERERLQVLFLQGAEYLAQVSVRLNEYNRCLYWCQRILQQEITWEEAYRLTIFSYYQQDNRPQALKWYKRCEDVLKRELGVEPTMATKELLNLLE